MRLHCDHRATCAKNQSFVIRDLERLDLGREEEPVRLVRRRRPRRLEAVDDVLLDGIGSLVPHPRAAPHEPLREERRFQCFHRCESSFCNLRHFSTAMP